MAASPGTTPVDGVLLASGTDVSSTPYVSTPLLPDDQVQDLLKLQKVLAQ